MELRQLEYLVAVADEANFTRAAARLHVAQPGVSAQVRLLERELGAELLDRTSRRVRPTAAGEAVLPYARAALDSAIAARQAVQDFNDLARGRVAVGMVTACSSVNFFDALANFHDRYPGVEITLCEASSEQLLQSLVEGPLDLAWIGVGGPLPGGVETLPLLDEPLVLAVSRSHPVAKRKSFPLTGLRDLELVCLPKGTGMRQALELACGAMGFAPRVALEASNPAVVMQLANRNLGAAVVSESIARLHGAGLRAVPLVKPEVRSRIDLAWPANRPTTRAARALVAHVRSSL